MPTFSSWSEKRVLVTGGTGFLGRHVLQALRAAGAEQLTALGSKDYDLTSEPQVAKMFKEHRPQVIFHLAGLVGGILANRERPADFFYQNLMMGSLILHYASRLQVEKIIFAGAGCGYPEGAPMPLRETDLWNGSPQKESAPYSLAKRLLTVGAAAYLQQHKLASVTCIPGNIYGEFDNFNLHDSHVIPALVRRFVEAAQTQQPTVEVWGNGEPTRDYIYAGDVARGMVRAAEVYSQAEIVNLSSGVEASVREVCALIQRHSGFTGEIRWNTSRPSGQARRYFDISKAERDLDFRPSTSLEAGLKKTIEWFVKNIDSAELRR
jgi:GDP-L-fucose synthase